MVTNFKQMKIYIYIIAIVVVVFSVYLYKKKQHKQVEGLGKLNAHRPPKIRIVYSRNQKANDRAKVTRSQDVYDWLRKIWSKQIDIREEMYVLYLNRNNEILGYHQLSMGGINGTVADVRLLFAVAVKSLCSSVLLAHNHPSGNLRPSNADIQLTKKIKEAGNILDISVLDHLIVTKDGYYSLADEGDM